MVVFGRRCARIRVEFGLELLVERRGRFVEEQPVRPHQQRAGDREALLLAAGKALRPDLLAIELVGEKAEMRIASARADVLVRIGVRAPPDR